jgi:hypothetical protein
MRAGAFLFKFRPRSGKSQRRAVLLFAAATSAAAISCSSDPAGTGEGDVSPALPAAKSGLPCDVDAALERRCRSCHAQKPLYGAPMPLVTHADLAAQSRMYPTERIADRVAKRIHDDRRPMPPSPNERLNAADSAAIDAWVAAGAPRVDDDRCTALTNPPAPKPKPVSCVTDVHMKPKSAWAMPADLDDVYVCYGFDVTPSQKRHLTAIAPLIDNPSIVHHLVLFESPKSVSPIPHQCSEASSVQMRALYGWAPGGVPLELPEEAGFAQEGTMHYVVQVHYNNVQHVAGQSDQSGFDFCTTDQLRPNDADGLVFGTTNIDIPARSTLDTTCKYTVGAELANVHLFASMPHMHQLGTSITNTLQPAKGGAPVDLGSRSSWDFENQPYESVTATLQPGDVVTTRCAWKNPSGVPVGFGPNTADEMCFSFMMFYPKIQSTQWSWMMPAIRSSCSPTP